MKNKNNESVRSRLWEESAGCCIYCGRPVSLEEMAVDHIVPRSMGGADSYQNKVCACRACNAQKGSTPLEEYLLENFPDSRLRRYRNRLNTLVEQGRMNSLKAEDLYPIGSIYQESAPQEEMHWDNSRLPCLPCCCPFAFRCR